MRYSRGNRAAKPGSAQTPRRRPVRRPKLPLRETLAILRVIATRRATITDLTRAVHMSRATVYRIMTACKRDLGMRIECEARVFKLRDWGLLNRRKVLK
jgi:IclR helix-turn-helix domain